jgi:hypothetical protein
MVASLRNVSVRSVTIREQIAPPAPPLFEADFTLFSNGPVSGQDAQQFNATYANAEIGTWPAGAPLYSGDPWPAYWNGYTIAQFASPWYISGGKLYENGTGNTPGLYLPIYIPFALLTNTLKFTVKFVAVGTKPANPNRGLPYIFPTILRDSGDDISNAELYFQDDTSPNNILYNGSSSFNYGANPSDFTVPEIWDGLEHTLVWEINDIGQVLLTFDGTPYGEQVVPWYSGTEPSDETYFALGATYLGDRDTIETFGFTYVKIESL